MNRKTFVQQLSVLSAGVCIHTGGLMPSGPAPSAFSKHLKPLGRALELEGFYVWCNSPITGPDGKTHVFFSRWNAAKKMSGWINGSEIVHAVADKPEGPYEVRGTVLQPRPGYWDATTCHNPFITTFNNKYYLYYMGNANGKTNTKRIGLAVADTLDGPWERMDHPLLEPGRKGSWDDHCTTNPSVIQHPDGRYWLYYKSWNTREYETQTGAVRGNRKYGLAFSDQPEGPFKKYEGNPIVDFSKRGNNAQLEDAFIWQQGNTFYMIARDMGYYNHECGIILTSRNGMVWGKPKIAFYGAERYLQQPPAPPHLKRYGRFERPQLLLQKGKPTHLFTTSQGGKYHTASSFIFKIT
ncbi:glycoside hydrolase family protein [Niabella sp. CC-SYL272]|uniref:glycoside hydrolase family protein n=1 Tax=Niabella agricola TaxID=2891571 RepID=UPI001F36CE71|nr:glycoside hydrolase family protein [Niabella agricola]MCF3108147.1 glycoside hydrolase family protein [Niabella agricola]